MTLTRVPNAFHLTRNVQNRVDFWGSAPNPAGGAYNAPPDPLVVRASCLRQSQLRAFGACNYPDTHVLVDIQASKPPFHLFAPQLPSSGYATVRHTVFASPSVPYANHLAAMGSEI